MALDLHVGEGLLRQGGGHDDGERGEEGGLREHGVVVTKVRWALSILWWRERDGKQGREGRSDGGVTENRGFGE